MHAVGTLLLAGIGAFIANFAAKFVEAQVRRSQVGETQRDADLQDLIVAAGLLGALSEKFWTKSATELGTEDQILRSHLMAQQHNIAELVNSLFRAKTSGTVTSRCTLSSRRQRAETSATKTGKRSPVD